MRPNLPRRSLGALLSTLLLPAATAFASPPSPPAATPGGDAQGFLHGRVTTRDGKAYEGRLRWDDEEAFWGDFFNSAKDENPWLEHAPRRERESRKRRIEVLGIPIITIDEDDILDGRQFIARFGDIARLEPGRGDEARVTLKDGTVFEVDGGSNDVEADVTVWDGSLGEIEIEWRRIRSVEFFAAPVSLRVGERRLHGTVRTRDGEFRGHVQWDQDECLSSDVIDGETENGDVKVRLDRIRAIERRSSRSATLTLGDGREVVVSGSNDVDSSNRGIYVDDPRFGRVLVSWSAFERFDVVPAGSGPGYEAFPPAEPLRGTVKTHDGRSLTGRIVYDLDESLTVEMLDGKDADVDYSIPFALVAAIEPRGDSSQVTLRTGASLVLEDSADVDEGNAGVLVFVPGQERASYVRWSDVERVELVAPAASWPPARKLPAEAG